MMNEVRHDPEDRRLFVRGPVLKGWTKGPVLLDVSVVHAGYYA